MENFSLRWNTPASQVVLKILESRTLSKLNETIQQFGQQENPVESTKQILLRLTLRWQVEIPYLRSDEAILLDQARESPAYSLQTAGTEEFSWFESVGQSQFV